MGTPKDVRRGGRKRQGAGWPAQGVGTEESHQDEVQWRRNILSESGAYLTWAWGLSQECEPLWEALGWPFPLSLRHVSSPDPRLNRGSRMGMTAGAELLPGVSFPGQRPSGNPQAGGMGKSSLRGPCHHDTWWHGDQTTSKMTSVDSVKPRPWFSLSSVMLPECLHKKSHCWASLVAQWLRICLPMQGTRVFFKKKKSHCFAIDRKPPGTQGPPQWSALNRSGSDLKPNTW